MFPVGIARSVLVVEDDADLRDLYRAALRAVGYLVTAVEDGLDALRRVDCQRPDVVVLDLGLPRVSGRDVQRELKAHPHTQRIPIVVVTGMDTTDLNPRDCACILKKPINADALIAAVQKCFRR